MDALDEVQSLESNGRRPTLFRALAMAEVTLISLSREMEMIHRLEKEFRLGLQFPEEVRLEQKCVAPDAERFGAH